MKTGIHVDRKCNERGNIGPWSVFVRALVHLMSPYQCQNLGLIFSQYTPPLHLFNEICVFYFQTFLFITTKKVVGCSVAVQIDQVCWFHFSLKFLSPLLAQGLEV